MKKLFLLIAIILIATTAFADRPFQNYKSNSIVSTQLENWAVSSAYESVMSETFTPEPAATHLTVVSDFSGYGDYGIGNTGSGIWTVRIIGWTSNYATTNETVTMKGTTGVVTANQYLWVDKINAVASSNNNTATAAGNIFIGSGTLTAGKPENVHLKIPSGTSDSNKFVKSWFFIKPGQQFYLYEFEISSSGSNTIDVRLYSEDEYGIASSRNYHVDGGWIPYRVGSNIGIPLVYSEKTFLDFQARHPGSGDRVSIDIYGIFGR